MGRWPRGDRADGEVEIFIFYPHCHPERQRRISLSYRTKARAEMLRRRAHMLLMYPNHIGALLSMTKEVGGVASHHPLSYLLFQLRSLGLRFRYTFTSTRCCCTAYRSRVIRGYIEPRTVAYRVAARQHIDLITAPCKTVAFAQNNKTGVTQR